MKNNSLEITSLSELKNNIDKLKIEYMNLLNNFKKIEKDYYDLKNQSFHGESYNEMLLCYEALIKKNSNIIAKFSLIIKLLNVSYTKYSSVFQDNTEATK